MIGRIAFATLLFAMGAFSSIVAFVATWVSTLCFEWGMSQFDGMSFGAALRGAWSASTLDIIQLTAFVWPVAAALRANSRVIVILAFILTAFPFAILFEQEVRFGFRSFCPTGVLWFFVQFCVVLPAGVVLFLLAGNKKTAKLDPLAQEKYL
jgi:hypothetical protein